MHPPGFSPERCSLRCIPPGASTATPGTSASPSEASTTPMAEMLSRRRASASV